MHITLSGGIIADIADAFVFVFKRLIINLIVKEVNGNVPSVISAQINSVLASTNGRETVYGNYMFDFSFTSNPKITDNNMELFLNATIYDSVTGYEFPAVAVSDVQILTPSNNSVELSVSHFTADSLLMAL